MAKSLVGKTRNRLKPGPKSALTDELFKKIREGIMKGYRLREIAKKYNINEGTLYVWHSDNYLNLAIKVQNWRLERKLKLAEKNLEDMLTMKTNKRIFKKNSDGSEDILDLEEIDPALVRVKADMSKFALETLGKKFYSKNTEHNTNINIKVDLKDEDKKKIDKSLNTILNNGVYETDKTNLGDTE